MKVKRKKKKKIVFNSSRISPPDHFNIWIISWIKCNYYYNTYGKLICDINARIVKKRQREQNIIMNEQVSDAQVNIIVVFDEEVNAHKENKKNK